VISINPGLGYVLAYEVRPSKADWGGAPKFGYGLQNNNPNPVKAEFRNCELGN
jgi:hypothetical protein